MSYSSSHLSTTCLPHAVIWVDSSYHHQFFSLTVINLLDFIHLIFTFITLMFIDFEYDVSLYILVILPISPHITLFASHRYHRHFLWMSLCPWLMKLLMHVAFHTREDEVDRSVFGPSFPSSLLPYHPKPTLWYVS